MLKNNNKEYITIHRNHIVPYYPKEKHIKLELQKLFTNERNSNFKTTYYTNITKATYSTK